MKELDQLVKMANQIAANFSFHSDGVQRLADHLARFWAPAMRSQLQEYADTGGEGLDEMVREALKTLKAA